MLVILLTMFIYFFFFFKQKTAYEMRISDWSSDVCSSDLTDKRVDAFRYREWIERINSLDIALYSEARNAAAYSERDWLDDGVPPVMNARAVYRPITDGTKVMVSSIPGRQGF